MKVTLPKNGWKATQQLLEIRTSILKKDLPNVIKDEQRSGDFPGEYDLIVTQKGKQAKRQLKTLSPYYFTIGTQSRPTLFEFVAGDDWGPVVDAIRFATSLFLRRAPMVSGDYASSLDIQGKGSRLRGTGLDQAVETYDSVDRIYVGPTVAYSAVIEAGHYTNYYQSALRGGIMAYIAKEVRKRYGANVSCRLVYRAIGGSRFPSPVLEFGVAGQFASVDKKPGSNKRKSSRR